MMKQTNLYVAEILQFFLLYYKQSQDSSHISPSFFDFQQSSLTN